MSIYLGKETRFTWCGHSTFLIDLPGGERVIIDPWLQDNPRCPAHLKDPETIDLILITHGHADHMADAEALAKKHDAPVICNYEISLYLARKGVQNLIAMNKGGTTEACNLQVTMTHAFHSSSIVDGDDVLYGGEAAGYVIETENEFRFYHAGDTCVFGDMKLIAELHRPEVAMLPIGDQFTMGPREAARAAQLLGARIILPMHWGTFPMLTGTPAALREAIGSLPIHVADLQPGDHLE